MPKRKRNPKRYTTDEAQTATLLGTEGSTECTRMNKYRYAGLVIRVCDKELLEPASRTFKTSIRPLHTTRILCRPDLFPPEGKGIWRIRTKGKPAEKLVEHLKPLLSKEFIRKWEAQLAKCR